MHQRVHSKYYSVMDYSCFTHSTLAHLQFFRVSYVRTVRHWGEDLCLFFYCYPVRFCLCLFRSRLVRPKPLAAPSATSTDANLNMEMQQGRCLRARTESGRSEHWSWSEPQMPSYASQMACRTRPLEVTMSDICLKLKHPSDSQNNTLKSPLLTNGVSGIILYIHSLCSKRGLGLFRMAFYHTIFTVWRLYTMYN